MQMRQLEGALEARDIDPDHIREAITTAIDWFDPDSVPDSGPDDPYGNAYDRAFKQQLWDAAECALREAGFDLDDDAIWVFAWDDFDQVRRANLEWAGYKLGKSENQRLNREMAQHWILTHAPTRTPSSRSSTRARSRQSRGRTVRSRGSRRVTSRSAGGGSSGDDECKAACTADNNCRAWTYARPGYAGKSARCFLKKDIKPPRRKAGFTSGVVR